MTEQSQFEYVCVRCETVYDAGVKDDWGKLAAHAGLGPTPCCVELVENPARKAFQVCKGDLVARARQP